ARSFTTCKLPRRNRSAPCLSEKFTRSNASTNVVREPIEKAPLTRGFLLRGDAKRKACLKISIGVDDGGLPLERHACQLLFHMFARVPLGVLTKRMGVRTEEHDSIC